MRSFSFRSVVALVILPTIAVSLGGCSGTLSQQSQTVRVSPVSEKYKLDNRLQGRTFILLAETSTGQEQHRYAVSDSLARALEESSSPQAAAGLQAAENTKGRVDLSFLGFDGNKYKRARLCGDGLEVMSFTDLTNRLNERDLASRHAEMKKFYQQNGMFRKADLEFLAQEVGADYIILPCLLDVMRWSKGRFSVGGVRFLQTHVVTGMLGMEIWDTKTGRKVFSATSDITLASERIKEKPMSMEDAFVRAWHGIMNKLPGQFLESAEPHVDIAGIIEAPDNSSDDSGEPKGKVATGELAKAGG